MRYFLTAILLFSIGTAWAQDDSTPSLQKAKEELQKAQKDYDAAVKAGQPASSASTPSTAAHERLNPIDTSLDVYSDGTVGLEYSYQGRPLESFEDFADVINTSNDAKCRSLLTKSSSEDTFGWVAMAAGFGVMTYGVVDLVNKADDNNFNGPVANLGPDFTLIAASNFVIVAGTILFVASHGDFTHAINRYNKLVQKQDQTTSLFFVPNPNQPEVELVQEF